MDDLTFYDELCKSLHRLSGATVILCQGQTFLSRHESLTLPEGLNLHQTQFQKLWSDPGMVSYTVEDNKFFYGLIKKRDSSFSFLIGPLCLSSVSESELKRYFFRHNVPKEQQPAVSEYLFPAPVIPFHGAIQLLIFFNLAVNRESLAPTAVIFGDLLQHPDPLEQTFGEMFRHHEQLQFDEVERHTSLQFENRMLFYVQNGLPEKLLELFENVEVGRTGKLSSDSLRQEKNNGICSTTLCTRAAIAGGLNSEIAFQFSDITIQQIETCRTINEVDMVAFKATLELCERVAALQKNTSNHPMIDRIVKFIIEHICEKVTVEELARLVHTNRSFLSKKFKSEMGISLSEYISKQKITEAKRLLLHTEKSLAAIANYLAFSSQSHFQNTFKKFTGVTPAHYRTQKRTSTKYS